MKKNVCYEIIARPAKSDVEIKKFEPYFYELKEKFNNHKVKNNPKEIIDIRLSKDQDNAIVIKFWSEKMLHFGHELQSLRRISEGLAELDASIVTGKSHVLVTVNCVEVSNSVNMEEKLYTIEEIEKMLKSECGIKSENVKIVLTKGYDLTTNPSGRNSKKDRSHWADNVVEQIYLNTDRSNIVKKYPRKRSSGEYNFSYIKFGINDKGVIYGLVSGKSSFHCMYPSDVWFYEFDGKSKKKLEQCMIQNNLKWYEEKILILKNENVLDSKEAYDNERKMKNWFGLYD
ncbi:hypothetical protein ACTQ32_12315 [Roseburia faecis]|uniref:hypothetical protein n=1 Tax=Roseburia faecis TaxID=301302 RepID=UPI003F993706